jgi:hypothetical protein
LTGFHFVAIIYSVVSQRTRDVEERLKIKKASKGVPVTGKSDSWAGTDDLTAPL